MKLWRYVLATDNGTAPNYLPPYLTLALCKPKIRKHARRGDVVMAFAGSNLRGDPDAVVWAGVVTESLTFAQYWNDPRFGTKKAVPPIVGDNIYEPHPAQPTGYRQHAHTHHDAGSVRTDLDGQRVLVFGSPDTWIFRDDPRLLPTHFGLSMGPARRGHQVADLEPGQWSRLREWLSEGPGYESLTTIVDAKGKVNCMRQPRSASKGC
jgi:hypothetical protein